MVALERADRPDLPPLAAPASVPSRPVSTTPLAVCLCTKQHDGVLAFVSSLEADGHPVRDQGAEGDVDMGER